MSGLVIAAVVVDTGAQMGLAALVVAVAGSIACPLWLRRRDSRR